MIDDLRAGKLEGEVPPHGTLGTQRQHIPDDKGVGAVPPGRRHGRSCLDSGHCSGREELTMSTTDSPGAVTHDYIPGFYIGDRPKVVTSRFEYEDSHTSSASWRLMATTV